MRGRLLLLGPLGLFLYMGTSYAFGIAYNDLFLVYVAFFSASLFAFLLTFVSFVPVVSEFGDRLPRRGPGVFMCLSGLTTLALWLMDPLGGFVEAGPPRGLDSYTTLLTHALDIGVIVPAAVTAGMMILSRHRLGYVIAFSLLILEALLMPIIAVGTILQIQLGVSFTPAEIIGPIAGFSILAVASIWVIFAVLRRVPELAVAPA